MTDKEEETRVVHPDQTKAEPLGGGNDCLVVIYTKEPMLLGKRFVLEENPTVVGRKAECEIVLEGDSVSREHVKFLRRAGRWVMLDNNSTNGTYLNERQVAALIETGLDNNDRIKVGPTIFKYLSGADAESKYHEEIYRMTIVDGLTQIHNKRYLDEALERELMRARRHHRPLALAMFDIDYFKRINDQFGHLAGDHVLRELARVVQSRIRGEDIFARYGGEEFAIVMPETALSAAATLMKDIRALVAEHRFAFQGEQIPLTVSIGCAELAEADQGSAELVARADGKLYEAKNGGRNRVSF